MREHERAGFRGVTDLEHAARHTEAAESESTLEREFWSHDAPDLRLLVRLVGQRLDALELDARIEDATDAALVPARDNDVEALRREVQMLRAELSVR